MGRTRAENRINEETVCANCLVHHLKARCQCQHVEARSNRPNDPPDFWVDVDGVRFAAEVTSIVTGEGYRADAKRLAKEIEARCLSTGTGISGMYVLRILQRPAMPKPYSRDRDSVIQEAASFVRGSDPQKRARVLLRHRTGRLTIENVSREGSHLGLVQFGAEREGECLPELQQLMYDAMRKKKHKLRGIADPVILVLYDAFAFAQPDDAKEALLQTTDHLRFHSIFWAASFADRPNELAPNEPGRNGVFLYTCCERWLKGATG